MNPLQKKCILATAGFHLLLLVILFLGPGFFNRQPPPDTFPTLKLIPANAVDAALNSGSTAATPVPVTPTPPAPTTPPVTPPPDPTPTPPEPAKPVVTPDPTPQPEVQPTKPVEPDVPDKPDDTPQPHPPPKPKPAHKIEVNLTPIVIHTPKKHVRDTTAEDEAAADAKAERAEAHRRALQIARLTGSIKDNLTEGTDVSVPGPGSQSYANYGQIVKSIYQNAWVPPDSADSDEASPKVRVVISRDGSVISAHLITPSGDKALDDSVQRTLDRVTFIRAFPEGATENERSYIINFNLKAKRMLG